LDFGFLFLYHTCWYTPTFSVFVLDRTVLVQKQDRNTKRDPERNPEDDIFPSI
jgi:hypothetical protein